MSWIKYTATCYINSLPLVVTLSYEASDPYAVTMLIHDNGNEWKFARENLSGGGLMDVVIVYNEDRVSITLSGEGKSATLVFHREDVVLFLQATEQIVPVGQESDFIDWDKEFEYLTSKE